MKPQSKQENLVIQNIDKELLIYDLNDGKVYCLNETSAFIWNNLDGKTNLEGLRSKISRQFKKDVEQEFVLLALHELRKVNLIDEATMPLENRKFNRREAVRRIGLTTAITLPMISSIVAPLAAFAAQAAVS